MYFNHCFLAMQNRPAVLCRLLSVLLFFSTTLSTNLAGTAGSQSSGEWEGEEEGRESSIWLLTLMWECSSPQLSGPSVYLELIPFYAGCGWALGTPVLLSVVSVLMNDGWMSFQKFLALPIVHFTHTLSVIGPSLPSMASC